MARKARKDNSKLREMMDEYGVKTMEESLKHEIYKLTHIRYCKIIFILFLLYAIYAAIASILVYQRSLNEVQNYSRDSQGYFQEDINLYGNNLFNKWIGGKMGYDFSSTIFYYILPLLITVPYGLSFYNERKNGYIRHLVTRHTRQIYFVSKYITSFISGFFIILFTLLLNILIVSAFIPAYYPDPTKSSIAGIFPEQFLSVFYFKNPYFYMIAYVLLQCTFGGLWATIPLALILLTCHDYEILKELSDVIYLMENGRLHQKSII